MPCTYGKCGGNIAADGFRLMISKCENKADRLYGDLEKPYGTNLR